MTQLATSARCQKCRRPIAWVRTEAGRAMPLDTFPNDEGNVVLLGRGRCRVLAPNDRIDARARSEQLWMPHFATCPDRKRAAGQHRREASETAPDS